MAHSHATVSCPTSPAAAPVWQVLPLALSHALLSLAYLTLLVAGLHRARRVFARRGVRRALDTGTGLALLGFGTRLAAESP
ncbi:LysE family transporter [Micromonospora zhanjiangensis]|uniref:LysE family transporter n=1 Tax=Micromonospora zhanjiangensis TaxID=1522057 RepID=A0ABV8KU64_9ACTN